MTIWGGGGGDFIWIITQNVNFLKQQVENDEELVLLNI